MKFHTRRLQPKRFGALVLASSMLTLSACGSDSISYKPLTEEDDTVYNICVVQSADNDQSNQIQQGFQDALTDLFGEGHFNVTVQVANAETSVDDISSSYVSDDNTQLIFANGSSALTSAAFYTDEIPIVGANVIDFQSALHTPDSEWDVKTGTNVTGISSRPPIAAQLSLLIEATKDMQSVGILYCPEDTNAIYQNEILEDYLNQAGIPWREYEIPSTEAAITSHEESSETESSGSTISGEKTVANSAKEGTENDVESIGESNVILGLNSIYSARTAKISDNWTQDINDPVSYELGSTTEEIVNYAASQSSAFFISANSYLTDQIDTISSVATATGTTTVSADSTIASKTLVSLYCDPYNQGYNAGKLVYRILVNGDDPGSIKITATNADETVKLYQDSLAEQFGLTFGKSFQEVDEFLSTYVPGTNTTRITSDDSSQ